MKAVDFEISMPQLRCFITVVDAGSIAEGARRLGMSSASVSKAITRLEEGAGVRLLHRSTHALSLTEDGERLLGPAREAVRAAQSFEDAMEDRGDVGLVRVTAAVALARNVLAPVLGKLAREHPGLRVDVRATNELVDLADDGVDLAIRSGSLAGIPGHQHQVWFRCPWVMCAAPSYLADHAAPRALADLDAHDVLGFRNRRTGRIEGWPHAEGRFEPRPRFSFDDGDLVWSTMLAGAGIACAPLYLAAPALRAGAAVEVLRPLRGPPITVAMVRRERKLSPPRLTTLMTFLAANAPVLDDLL